MIPYISGKKKVPAETNKLLGKLSKNSVSASSINIFCSCNRVAVINGHLESVYIESEDVIKDPEDVLESFSGLPQELGLPSAPRKPIVLRKEQDSPQPRLDRMEGKGMSTVVGRVRQSAIRPYNITF